MLVSVHFLELVPSDFRPRKVDRDDVRFSLVAPPMPELNRFFYFAVGAPWYWIDRRPWSYEEWSSHLGRDDGRGVETWVLSERGVPAGYVELERRADTAAEPAAEGTSAFAVEVKYLGLLPQFIGRGLGAHLLSCAVERGFAMGATKVLLDTCSLDHPKALANYRARGFREVRSETREKELPSEPLGAWEGARGTQR